MRFFIFIFILPPGLIVANAIESSHLHHSRPIHSAWEQKRDRGMGRESTDLTVFISSYFTCQRTNRSLPYLLRVYHRSPIRRCASTRVSLHFVALAKK